LLWLGLGFFFLFLDSCIIDHQLAKPIAKYLFIFIANAIILVIYLDFRQLLWRHTMAVIISRVYPGKGPPHFLTEGHMSMTKSGLACVYYVVVV